MSDKPPVIVNIVQSSPEPDTRPSTEHINNSNFLIWLILATIGMCLGFGAIGSD